MRQQVESPENQRGQKKPGLDVRSEPLDGNMDKGI